MRTVDQALFRRRHVLAGAIGSAAVCGAPVAGRAESAVPPNVEARWQEWLSGEGLREGGNDRDGRRVFVARGDFAVTADPGTQSWLASRLAAFGAAELKARQAMADHIAAWVRSGRELRGCQSVGEGTSRPQDIGAKRLTEPLH